MKGSGFRRLLAVFGVTAAVMLAGTAPGLAADRGAGARFHVDANFNAMVVGVGVCAIHVTASGTALGTQIGTGLWSDSEVLDPCSQAPNVHVVGDGVLTAASGDELMIHYDMTTPFPDANNQIHPRGTFTIVGGTGRFAGASGGGMVAVDGTAGAAETGVFDGTIVLGSNG